MRDTRCGNGRHGVREWWTRVVGMLDTPKAQPVRACPTLQRPVLTVPAPRVNHSETLCPDKLGQARRHGLASAAQRQKCESRGLVGRGASPLHVPEHPCRRQRVRCSLTDVRDCLTARERRATRMTSGTAIAACSFCLKPNSEVDTLVAGPGVFICAGCVDLCRQVIEGKPAQVPQLAPWDHVHDVQEVLTTLPRVAKASAQVEENLVGWVRRARALGASWARIGAALEMTRQSAWERFSGEE